MIRKGDAEAEARTRRQAKRIDELVRASGMSAGELARRSGVDPAVIAKLRSGKRSAENLRYETAYSLAEALGVDIWDIVGREARGEVVPYGRG